MPATTVHVGFALLVAAGLLADALDRRMLAVLLVILVVPELDAIVGWWLPGAHRTVGHTLVLTAALAVLVYYDARVRESSWLREHGGPWAVRVAWVALVVNAFTHVLLDWAHLDGVNLLWPLHDGFYRLEGELVLSTREGIEQTFVDFAEGTDLGQRGTREEVHVSTPADPTPEDDSAADTERIVPIAVHGWQLYLVVVGLFTVAARRLQGEPPADGRFEE